MKPGWPLIDARTWKEGSGVNRDQHPPALARLLQIAIFPTSSFWMSHSDRMQSGRFLRVGSPRDPLFFVTETGEAPGRAETVF
jgi:hypothetical protein